MPLVWAHSEYIKLLRSIHEGKVWDLPPQTVQRYQVEKRTASFQIWTQVQKRGWLSPSKDLRVDLPVAACIRWRASGGSGDMQTYDTGFGLHTATVPCATMAHAGRIEISIEPKDAASDKLEAQSFIIHVKEAKQADEETQSQ
jgi:glucoamylase